MSLNKINFIDADDDENYEVGRMVAVYTHGSMSADPVPAVLKGYIETDLQPERYVFANICGYWADDPINHVLNLAKDEETKTVKDKLDLMFERLKTEREEENKLQKLMKNSNRKPSEEIEFLRFENTKLKEKIQEYESLVAEQQLELRKMKKI